MSRVLVALAAMVVLLSLVPAPAAASTGDPVAMHVATGDWIYANVTDPTVGSTQGEWAIVGLARSGYEAADRFTTYHSNLLSALHAGGGLLSTSSYTEYSRVVIALGAIGKDVTNIGGYNLLSHLADYEKVTRQGINGAAHALIALDTHEYEIPNVEAETPTTRDSLIAFILDAELADGGWTLSGADHDPDVTAMAIQALAPYCGNRPDVEAAVERAIAVLSETQLADGRFESWGATGSESISQVIIALCTLGIDPLQDLRFVKGSATLFSALSEYYTEDGSFKHVADGKSDQMATEQAYNALTAYLRLVNDQTSLYDMSDVPITRSTVTFADVPSSSPYYVATGALAELGIIGGYQTSDGVEFRPGNPILRAQVAKMLVMGFGLHDEPTTDADRPAFGDVPPSLGIPYPFDFVQEASSGGLINGYPDQTFRPFADVTRMQLLRMLVRGAGDRLTTPPAGYEVGFTDIAPADRDIVAIGKYNEIIDGRSATTFDPGGPATRGQFAKMLYNVLKK
ncbi:MAG: S-layer homology domain-containing protein [Sedimentisphaerales bacterium]|nr:S-layer homology domain-containing protein [Sedimentisphaerales bacterium]